MTSNQLKHQAKLQEWAGVIQECRSSGMSVKKWYGNHGITTTTYYRWERKVLSMASSLQSNPLQPATTPTFAELPVPQESSRTVAQQAATMHINGVVIDIYSGMDRLL